MPIDVYFWTVAAAVVIALGAAASRGRLPGLPRACSASTTPLPPRWRRLVRNAQGTARLIHKIDLFVFAFALAAVGVAAGFSIAAGTTLFERIPYADVPPKPSRVVTDAATWLLVAGVVFVVLRARKAASDNRTRRFIGQAWDALAFWPRRFHPFAIRPYTHIAVPALRAHLEELQVEGPVLVSAHSQGSAIAAVAILQMEDVAGIGLITYGSHLGTLYRRAFPSYFGPHQIRMLRDHLDGPGGVRWRNLYRLTDPIGGPVFATSTTEDICVADPATTAAAVCEPLDPPLEMDREPWMDLAIHSHYLREQAVKRVVADMKSSLISSVVEEQHSAH